MKKFLVISFNPDEAETHYDRVPAEKAADALEAISYIRGDSNLVVDVFSEDDLAALFTKFLDAKLPEVIGEFAALIKFESATCPFCDALFRVDSDGALHCECTEIEALQTGKGAEEYEWDEEAQA